VLNPPQKKMLSNKTMASSKASSVFITSAMSNTVAKQASQSKLRTKGHLSITVESHSPVFALFGNHDVFVVGFLAAESCVSAIIDGSRGISEVNVGNFVPPSQNAHLASGKTQIGANLISLIVNQSIYCSFLLRQ